MRYFKNIAKLVKKNRLKKCLSQGELSEKIGYKNGQFISNVERGLCGIPKKKVFEVTMVLSIEYKEILNAILEDERITIDSFYEDSIERNCSGGEL